MSTYPPISLAGSRVPGRLGRVGVCLMHWQWAWVHRQFLRSSLTRRPTGAKSNLDKSVMGHGIDLDKCSTVEGPRGRKRHMMVYNTWHSASHA